MATIEELQKETEGKMDRAIQALLTELAAIRTGRATPSLLDQVRVDYYGTATPVNQVANVSVPEPRMIEIKPWDRGLLKDIEKAIMTSDLGLNPSNDGTVIRLNLPILTEERRKDLVKVVNKKGEASRVEIRNIRRDFNDAIKKQVKAKTITEDDAKDATETSQKLTDKYIKKIDDILAKKEKEVMSV
ncbi:ribosome recycling factor [Acidaminococcus sp. NSJ-142]|jgi:ribosome recycling factor|uniref:ribosome recycling factor n=1 Tax=Acidaminococcus TaxID=904 RepID=UPI000CF91785|nr:MULTISPECIES: ribosome recycling factor [Acidaminococcus]MCD2435508.1 ribosome recycling factor [Acidaminococcus hominis]MCH4095219.1 ribosome recycling factor [Acidaminococcus provencensis]RHK03475.1 ribosome recycling factor [Acidaminococcus sp. AM05-11]